MAMHMQQRIAFSGNNGRRGFCFSEGWFFQYSSPTLKWERVVGRGSTFMEAIVREGSWDLGKDITSEMEIQRIFNKKRNSYYD